MQLPVKSQQKKAQYIYIYNMYKKCGHAFVCMRALRLFKTVLEVYMRGCEGMLKEGRNCKVARVRSFTSGSSFVSKSFSGEYKFE